MVHMRYNKVYPRERKAQKNCEEYSTNRNKSSEMRTYITNGSMNVPEQQKVATLHGVQ